MDTFIFTKKGFEDLKNKAELLVKERPAAVLDLKKAREMGDLSENGYYKAAKFKLVDIDRSIRRNNYLIKNAKVIIPSDNDKIDIGHKITIEIDNLRKKYEIVGEYEANPIEGKISYLSPVGKALMGKKVGDKAIVELKDKVITYDVVELTS